MSADVRPVDVVLGGLRGERLVRAEQLIREEVERLRLAGAGIGPVPAPPPLLMDAALAARPAWDAVPAGVVVAGDGRDPVPPQAQRPVAPPAGPAVPLRSFAGCGGGGRVAVHLPAANGADGDRVAEGLAPSPSGHFYELWLVGADGRLASLGSFRVGADRKARIRFALAADVRAYEYLDVSVEPDDGDPGHSKRSVLRSRRLT